MKKLRLESVIDESVVKIVKQLGEYNLYSPSRHEDAVYIVDKCNNVVASLYSSAQISIVTEGNTEESSISTINNDISIDIGNGISLSMVYIPKGSFTMGSSLVGNAQPEHLVEINEPFYMGKYLITQDQWDQVMNNTPLVSKKVNYPVNNVSYMDANNFCSKLNVLTGRPFRFRLPSEAEWEYACRAGSTTDYYFGDDKNELKKYAWFYDNSNNRLHSVGEKKPNNFGLYDMHGNLWEWCEDDYVYNYNEPRAQKAYINTDAQSKVLRGGSWYSNISNCHSARRNWDDASTRLSIFYGFRVVCSLN